MSEIFITGTGKKQKLYYPEDHIRLDLKSDPQLLDEYEDHIRWQNRNYFGSANEKVKAIEKELGKDRCQAHVQAKQLKAQEEAANRRESRGYIFATLLSFASLLIFTSAFLLLKRLQF